MTRRFGADDPRSLPIYDIAVRDPWVRPFDEALDATGDEAAWFAAVREALEAAYLATDDPFQQSGTSADAARWERNRRPIVEAIDRDGMMLDVGCANGLLMETLTAWAAERGFSIEPHGLDFSERIAALARLRYPEWAERIKLGNSLSWRPQRRFDVVRTNLEFVPLPRYRAQIEHLLAHVVAPAGRLIVCSYGSGRRPAPRVEPVAEMLRAWGYDVAGEASATEPNGVVVTRVAWIDAATPRAG